MYYDTNFDSITNVDGFIKINGAFDVWIFLALVHHYFNLGSCFLLKVYIHLRDTSSYQNTSNGQYGCWTVM